MLLSFRIKFFLLLIIVISATNSISGQTRIISGIVTDSIGKPVQSATVRHIESQRVAVTRSNGRFDLSIPVSAKNTGIQITCVGYIEKVIIIPSGSKYITLSPVILSGAVFKVGEIRVTAHRRVEPSAMQIPVKASFTIPSISHGIEAVIRTLPGVSSYSELSSQYSVRGGSYDENLVYIDGVETYKPYLIRYGQQEGLSQINPDFVSSIVFSSGGFDASYGDRMSSVLDVKYRKPSTPELSMTASLLTSSLQTGIVSKNGGFYLMTGIRYKSNTLLVNSLDESGQYKPRFMDLQSYGGIRTGKHSQIKLLFSGSSNLYYFIPESQQTTFGSIVESYKLYTLFEGCEKDTYSNAGGTISFEAGIGKPFRSLISFSGLTAFENEAYDIRGAYSLNSLDMTESVGYTPDSTLNIGVGSWIDHARNRLRNNTLTVFWKSSYEKGDSRTEWGISTRLRDIDIDINEWQRVDSSGFTISADNEDLILTSFNTNTVQYRNLLYEAYLTERVTFNTGRYKWAINGGLRLFKDTFNNEMVISPRMTITTNPSESTTLYLAGGLYSQTVSGRELMQFTPEEAAKLTAQKSYHLVGGLKYDFNAWNRPFRFSAELYGKYQDDLIPYKVENVRISYFGGNIAQGYTAGLDLRINGEFVEGAESWFSLSFMKSLMEIPTLNTGLFPSPFDQRINANIFFQDYIPGRPDFRAHLNVVFGTGVPTSPQGMEIWDLYFRMPPYRRIDLGFSKVLIGEVNGRHFGKQNSTFKELTIGIELFNLPDIRNTISYTWIKTVENSLGQAGEYAVPNYLTGRRLNLRLTAKF